MIDELPVQPMSPVAGISARWQQGFTLVELMVTIAVLAILLGIAIPSFTESSLGSKLRSQANDLVAGVLLARSEAIKRNQSVVMCASSNGQTCAASGGWHQGWVIRSSGGEVIRAHAAAAQGFLINGSVSSVTFQPSGVGATQATLTICRATPTVGSQERQVIISVTGRASVSKTSTGSCS